MLKYLEALTGEKKFTVDSVVLIKIAPCETNLTSTKENQKKLKTFKQKFI